MKILFGSIVTSGRGKIGGQFVKRMPNGHSLNNLPSSKSKASLVTRNQLPSISRIFSQWSVISQADRDAWITLASLYPVVDAFGNLKNLTGRQFFTKANGQNLRNTTDILDPTSFHTIVNTGTFEPVNSSVQFQYIVVSVEFFDYGIDFFFRVDRIANASIKPRYIKSKIVANGNYDDPGLMNIWGMVTTKYPNIKAGETYTISFTPRNSSGWLGTPIVFNMTID